tara:strand:- start:149 stop:307 length:159 start_codon:yes stop_codon:yes gene_type:complete
MAHTLQTGVISAARAKQALQIPTSTLQRYANRAARDRLPRSLQSLASFVLPA